VCFTLSMDAKTPQVPKTAEQSNIKKITREIIQEFVESGDVDEAMEDIKKKCSD